MFLIVVWVQCFVLFFWNVALHLGQVTSGKEILPEEMDAHFPQVDMIL